MKVHMHPRPMRRHQNPVEPADCQALVRLPGGPHPHPGLHLVFTLADGSTQLVAFPMDQLAELAQAVAIAAVGWGDQSTTTTRKTT